MIRFFSRGSYDNTDVIIFYLDASTFIPILLVMRQVGIICGPFLIFWTRTWDFNLFGTEINSYNSASLLESYTKHVFRYYLPLRVPSSADPQQILNLRFMVPSLNSHRIEPYKNHQIQIISIRECLRNTPMTFWSTQHARVEFQSNFHKSEFQLIFDFFQNDSRFHPSIVQARI